MQQLTPVRATHSLFRRTVAAVFVACVLASLPGALASTDGGSTGIAAVGTLPRWGDDVVAALGPEIVPVEDQFGFIPTWAEESGTVVTLPEARQLWQFYPTDNADTTAIAVRDLDTLELRTIVRIDAPLVRLSRPAAEWMMATDGDRRAFVVTDPVDRFSSDPISVVEIDLATFAQRRLPFDTTALAAGSLRPGGLSYDPFGDQVIGAYSLAGGFSVVSNANTYLLTVDLATGVLSDPRLVRSCTGPFPASEGNGYQFPVFVPTAEYAFVTCHRSGYGGLAVRLPRSAIGDPSSSEEPVVGPTYLNAVLNDPGSRRQFIVTRGGDVWAFDTDAMAFVGVVATTVQTLDALVGYGLDPITGRLFFQSPSYGVGVADARFFPIPQASTLPSLQFEGQEKIYGDGVSRFFVLPGRFTERAAEYTIYDAGPAPVPPGRADPDANTLDIAEQAGVTDARYFGSGSGYGLRVIVANGVTTAPPAPAVGAVSPTATALSQYGNSRCGFTDREVAFGRVVRAQYDTGSVVAEANPVFVDGRTVVDLEQPSRCDVYGRDGQNEVFSGVFGVAPGAASLVDNGSSTPRWDQRPAVCSTSSGGGTETGSASGTPELGRGDVSCPEPGGTLEAHSESAGIEGEVSVGRSTSDVTITRDGDGVHVESVSVASDIDVFGVIHIGEVHAVATSRSNGRPAGGPMSTHTITISGVSVNGQRLCDVCANDDVVNAFNTVMNGQAQIRLNPGVDAALLAGSPRGAVTAVQKSTERQVSDQALIGDFTTEVPALEVVTYNDNREWGRARQLYQLAGVSSVATYNIVLVPAGSGRVPGSLGGVGTGPLTGGVPGVAGGLPGGGTAIASGGHGGPLADVVDAIRDEIVDGYRLIVRHPREAGLILTALVLFAVPLYGWWRRTSLLEAVA